MDHRWLLVIPCDRVSQAFLILTRLSSQVQCKLERSLLQRERQLVCTSFRVQRGSENASGEQLFLTPSTFSSDRIAGRNSTKS
jgi:hypothetical protein